MNDLPPSSSIVASISYRRAIYKGFSSSGGTIPNVKHVKWLVEGFERIVHDELLAGTLGSSVQKLNVPPDFVESILEVTEEEVNA